MTADGVNLAIAFWGAITGTIALTLSLLQFYVERPRIKLQWLRNFVVLDQLATGQMRETKQRLARLIVTNVGRQSIRVIGASFATLEAGGDVRFYLFMHGVMKTEGRVLSPESPTTEFHAKESEVLDRAVFLSVTDGFGKSHNLWLVPWSQRFALRAKMKGKKSRASEEPGA
jgi:hypothetical protein